MFAPISMKYRFQLQLREIEKYLFYISVDSAKCIGKGVASRDMRRRAV